VDVSDEVSPFLKYRKGLIAWKVFHKGKGVKQPAMWYTDWRSVPEHHSRDSNKDAVKLLPSMFSDIYTRANNLPGAKKQDPLGLQKCLRLLPHDDNQGGFFCAVFEKSENWGSDIGGIKHDPGMLLDAWEDKSVRQKSVTDELDEFAKWFEAE
jgi:multisite-specific tRNA:(cytosine-C5)-methyltransferase